MTDAYAPADRGPRWDPMVRLTHWSIAAAVLLNGLITEEGEFLHTVIGYTAFALLALRLLWGVIGPEEARFSAFPLKPAAAMRHAGEIVAGRNVTHRSHNPIGALMIYALWGCLAAVVVTGLIMDQGRFGEGRGHERETASTEIRLEAPDRAVSLISPAYADDDEGYEKDGAYREGEDEDGIVKEIHEIAANLLLILAGMHVAGIAFESWRRDKNLTRVMVTGHPREDDTT